MLAPRVIVTDSRFVVLSLCLVSSLPWERPPQGRVSVLSAEGAPRGPPVGRGWGSSASAALLLHPRSLPRALLGFVPRHSQNPGIRAGCPFPPPPPPHPPRPQKAGQPHSRSGDRRGSGLEGSTLQRGLWAG